MLLAVVIDNWPSTVNSGVSASLAREYKMPTHYHYGGLLEMLKSPFFYLGVALGLAGVVVLKGDIKDNKSTGVK
jgi:hypothetical protein